MNSSPQLWPAARDLEEVQARFPDYEITQDRRVRPVRYHAVARKLTISPHSVITPDLAELIQALSGGQG